MSPYLIQFSEGVGIRWYGLMYVLAFVSGFFILKALFSKQTSPTARFLSQTDNLWDYLFVIMWGVILGGRLGYVFIYNFSYYWQQPLEVFQIWQGGMSFHGGLIGVVLGTIYFASKNKLNFWEIADAVVIPASLGLFFGRIGNFINKELWGRETTVSWCYDFGDSLCRHPSPLYEAFGEGLFVFIVLLGFSHYKKRKKGQALFLFLGLYGTVRFFLEYFRQPDVQIGLIGGCLTMGQILCLIMIIVAVSGLLSYKWKSVFS